MVGSFLFLKTAYFHIPNKTMVKLNIRNLTILMVFIWKNALVNSIYRTYGIVTNY
jgi:hypothetical protein